MRMLVVKLLFSVAMLVVDAEAATELLQNHDLENSNYNGIWYCQGSCTLTSNNDKYSGQHSVKVTNRHHNWEGLAQNVNVKAGHLYKISAYIKLLNLPAGKMYQKVDTMMACKDGNDHDKYTQFGSVPMVQQLRYGWTEIGGINYVGHGYHNCHIYFQVTSPQVNYLMDHVSLQEVTPNGNWETDANQQINQIRKADVTIRVTGAHVDTTNLQVELNQTSHEFAFGSCVDATMIADSSHQKYQNVFYQNFEWAVLENALKWRQMEWTRGHINYNRPRNAINALRNHGIKIRAHNIFWGVDNYVADWVKSLNIHDLQAAINERVQGVVTFTKGKVEHWDVNNEDQHGQFFEEHTGNPNITMAMFNKVHAVDNKVKLFLNDYGIVGYSDKAMALKDQAVKFKDAGIPIYGVGIQSHVGGNVDITSLKARLDLVAEAGLPIWITELTVNEADENKRASKLSDLLTLYFSHPSVEGVLLWGFWDGKIWLPNSALFNGPNFTPNAAGRAYRTLFNKTWRTHLTQTVRGSTPLHVRGFKGEYRVNVRHNGHLLKTETFTLDKNGQTLQIHLSGTGHSPSVSSIAVG